MIELIAPDRIIAEIRVATKDAAIAELAARAGGLIQGDADAILAALLARERLGSTGIGQGVAIPHARIPKLKKIFCLFARSAKAIEFDAIDSRPVDLFFLLLIPEDEQSGHLAALACVARRLRDPVTAGRLRQSRNPGELYDALVAMQGKTATA